MLTGQEEEILRTRLLDCFEEVWDDGEYYLLFGAEAGKRAKYGPHMIGEPKEEALAYLAKFKAKVVDELVKYIAESLKG